MPRSAAIDRPVKLTTALRESVRVQLDLFLHSEAEGRVPKGAYQRFLEERIREFFEWRSLDLSRWQLPGLVVRGPAQAVSALEALLNSKKDHQDV